MKAKYRNITYLVNVQSEVSGHGGRQSSRVELSTRESHEVASWSPGQTYCREECVWRKAMDFEKCKHLKTRQRKRSSKRYGNQPGNNQKCAVSQKQEQNKFQNGEKSNLKYWKCLLQLSKYILQSAKNSNDEPIFQKHL